MAVMNNSSKFEITLGNIPNAVKSCLSLACSKIEIENKYLNNFDFEKANVCHGDFGSTYNKEFNETVVEIIKQLDICHEKYQELQTLSKKYSFFTSKETLNMLHQHGLDATMDNDKHALIVTFQAARKPLKLWLTSSNDAPNYTKILVLASEPFLEKDILNLIQEKLNMNDNFLEFINKL